MHNGLKLFSVSTYKLTFTVQTLPDPMQLRFILCINGLQLFSDRTYIKLTFTDTVQTLPDPMHLRLKKYRLALHRCTSKGSSHKFSSEVAVSK